MDSIVELDNQITAPPWGEIGRSFTLGIVAGFSKLMLNVLNRTIVHNHSTFLDAVRHRQQGVGLITFTNHASTFDDPGVICGMLPWSFFWTEPLHKGVRWSLCAKEICFKNEFLRHFFTNGKTLPISRGEGVNQPTMTVAARRVGKGDWLHIFPEGRIHFSGVVGPFRWGVGKLMCDARKDSGGRDPVVLPFYHSGMGYVKPKGTAAPHPAGATVEVLVGQPLDLSHITCRCNQPGEDQEKVWRDISLAMHVALKALEARSPPNRNQEQQELEGQAAAAAVAGGAGPPLV